MVSHTKRYRVELHTWGNDWNGKSFFKVDKSEFDNINEVNEFTSFIEEMHKDIIRPDEFAKYKYRKKLPKYCYNDEKDYVYDDNHFWWGYAVIDFEQEKILYYGGVGLHDFINPTKSLRIKDIYFRKDNEIPKDYVWDEGEYEGWLKFRWGDGSNAIEKVKARKEKEELNRRLKLAEKELNEQLNPDFEF